MKVENSKEFYKLFNFEYSSNRKPCPCQQLHSMERVPFKSVSQLPFFFLELARVCTQQSKFSSWSVIKVTAVTICIKNLFKLLNWNEKQASSQSSHYYHIQLHRTLECFLSMRKFTLSCLKRAIVVHCGYPLDLLSLNYMHNACVS